MFQIVYFVLQVLILECFVAKDKLKKQNILDKLLEDICDDFCRVGNLAPWLVESAGIMCNIPGIPD